MRFSLIRQIKFFSFVLTLFFVILLIPKFVVGQVTQKSVRNQNSDTIKLIEKANNHPFRVNRIEFIGNVFIKDKDLRRSFESNTTSEGDIFTSQNFFRTLKNLSERNPIYPVRLKDVKISLDESNKDVYLLINIRERKTSK